MGLSSAVDWWEKWQLRVLVLTSLFFQYVLYFSIWVRRVPILGKFRVLVWIAYIAGDAMAIYALATLFNRRKQTWAGESSALEVLWAPILLIHLGGQPMISAYSLEDNELWKRHIITLVSQVTVALYVFCKWWSGEKTLLAAAILLFVLGIIKFALKPWALRTASFNSMQTSSIVLPEAQREEHNYSLKEYVQAAKKCVQDTTMVDTLYKLLDNGCEYMFLDMPVSFSFRMAQLPFFLKLKEKYAYNQLQDYLGSTFVVLYTRMGSLDSIMFIFLWLLLPFLGLASTVLFATSHKDGHNEKDIRVTYILLSCTAMMEFLLPCMALCVWIPCFEKFLHKSIDGWHDMVSQCNIMSFCVRKKKPTFLMKVATFNFLRDFINRHWYVQHVPIAFQITGVVRQHVEDGWKKYIRDAASYKRFSELRGQWAIRKHHQLGWSFKKPFVESVLIWHVATELCFYHPNTSLQGRQGKATERSREISNYMSYLLLNRPEMLMPGTRSDLFTLASKKIINNSNEPVDMTEEILAQKILNMPMHPSADDMISNAGKLAEALMKLDNEEERWNVIQGVWVGMLFYSASRCIGYLHAKSLGDGGECLTTIWLLCAFMGMETLVDRHQMSEPPQEEAEDEEEAAASSSHSLGRADESEDNFCPV